jgi:hypothetical protein
MAAMLGGAAGDLGQQIPLEQWFFEMPVCTRWWTTATVVTGLLVQCHVLTPFQLFYSFRAVFVRSQVGFSQIPKRKKKNQERREKERKRNKKKRLMHL